MFKPNVVYHLNTSFEQSKGGLKIKTLSSSCTSVGLKYNHDFIILQIPSGVYSSIHCLFLHEAVVGSSHNNLFFLVSFIRKRDVLS